MGSGKEAAPPRSAIADTLAAIAGEAYTVEAQINRRRTAAAAAGRADIPPRQLETLKTLCRKKGWAIDTVDQINKLDKNMPRRNKLAAEMGRGGKSIKRYINALKKQLDTS